MRVKVYIQDKHIASARRGSPYYCPVALAFSDMGQNVGVTRHWITFYSGATIYDMNLPKKIQRFIKRFDRGLKVRPISFMANVPIKRRLTYA